MKNPFLPAVAAACALLPCHSARADLYAYDGFDYQAISENVTLVGVDPANPTSGSAGSVGLGGAIAGANGAGQGGTSNIFQSAGLTLGNLNVRSGGGRYKNTAGAAAFMGYQYTGPTAATGSTLYTSHLVRLVVDKTSSSVVSLRLNTSKTAGSGTSYLVTYSDVASTVAARYDTAQTNGTGSMQQGTTYLVVGRFTNVGSTTGTRKATTYILNEVQFANFADGGFSDAQWDAVTTFGTGPDQVIARAEDNYTGANSYNLVTDGGIQFGIGNAGSNGGLGQDVLYDEMRCASTLAEALPTGPPPDPVPISLEVLDSTATEPTVSNPIVGRIIVNRLDSSTHAVVVRFSFSGSATLGTDYTLPTYAVIPASANSVVVEIKPKPDRILESDETVIVTAVPDSAYTLGPQNSAAITITDGPFITYPTRLFNHLAEGKSQKIVVYGTSLTAGNLWPPQVKTALDAAFPGLVTLINSGGSSQNSVWGVQNLNSKVISLAPDTVIIEFAVNDAVIREDYHSIITPAQARANLLSMINSIRTALPDCEIILQVMNPVINAPTNMTGATSRPNLALCQQTYRDVGREMGLLVMDHMPAWQSLLDQGTSAYLVSTAVPDGLHPSATGLQNYCSPVILRELGLTDHISPGAVMLHTNNHRAAEPLSAAGIPARTKITITRGGSTAAPLNVSLTFGGTAANGTDYGTLPTSATIPAGSSSVTVEMIPASDISAEGEETFTVQLNSGAGYTLASPNKASLIIEDRPFDHWRQGKFTVQELNDPLISGDIADPDNDGIRNLIEFFTNRLPKSANATGAVLRGTENISGSDYLTIIYDRYPGSKLTGIPQTSGNLTDWNDGPTFVEETILSDTGLLQTIRARSLTPIGSGAEFMRLKVTRDP